MFNRLLNFLNNQKQRIAFLLAALAIAVSFFTLKPKNQTIEKLYVGNCSIINQSGEQYFFHTGALCDFFPDGRFLSFQSEDKTLTFYGKDESIIWEKKIDLHDTLKIAKDSKSFFTLSYDEQRLDVLSHFDLSGNLINSWNSRDHSKELSVMKNCSLPEANSVYQVPANNLSAIHEWAQENNLVVSLSGRGHVAFFSPDLKLLKTFPMGEDCKSIFHDVQVLQNGHLLMFRNKVNDTDTFSEILEYNLLENKVTWSMGVPQSEAFGSVQLLPNGNYLISETFKGGRVLEMTKPGKILWSFTNPNLAPEINSPMHFQSIKERMDLQFFSKAKNQDEI